MAASLALGMTGLCNAGTVYLSGSTAMRGTVYSTLIAPGAVFTAAPTTTLFGGGGSSANFMAFSGTLVGGSGTTVVQCHWTGSEGGILDVASNTVVQNTFIDSSLLDGTDHGAANPGTTTSQNVNLALADNSQPFSRTKTPSITANKLVGIITFKWVRNPGLWTGTSVSDNMIRQALKGGCPRSVFSGVDGQTNDFVYVSGRDNQSGTRVNAFADSGFGIFAPPGQIEMNNSGVMQLLNATDYVGDYGFSSGGTLAKTMGANTTAASDLNNGVTGYSVISYLSVGDAATAISSNAVEVAYNGVPFSAQAVKEGNYSFWGNEYLLKANNVVANSEADKVYTLLGTTSTGINNYCDGTKAIKVTDMHTTRSGPTSDPVHR